MKKLSLVAVGGLALALLAAQALIGCSSITDAATGGCTPGPPVYYLVDASTSNDSDELESDHIDGLAYAVNQATSDCTELTVARFGGSQAELEIYPPKSLVPAGIGDGERAQYASEVALPAFNELKAELTQGSIRQSSDQVGAIEWACDELEGRGTILMATDGLMTTPYDVMNPDFDESKASEVGSQIGQSISTNCRGVELRLVGLGRTASASQAPSPRNLDALELLWNSLIAEGGFAESSSAVSAQSDWAGAIEKLGEG